VGERGSNLGCPSKVDVLEGVITYMVICRKVVSSKEISAPS
jgi:hypothetical protein